MPRLVSENEKIKKPVANCTEESYEEEVNLPLSKSLFDSEKLETVSSKSKTGRNQSESLFEDTDQKEGSQSTIDLDNENSQ